MEVLFLVQVYRFRHWLADKADYKCSFRNKGTAGFECKPAVAAAPAGPEGSEVEVEVVFEPTAVGEGFRDVLVLSSPAGGEYECAVVGRCLPPKPQGPIDMVKVRDPVAWELVALVCITVCAWGSKQPSNQPLELQGGLGQRQGGPLRGYFRVAPVWLHSCMRFGMQAAAAVTQVVLVLARPSGAEDGCQSVDHPQADHVMDSTRCWSMGYQGWLKLCRRIL